MNFITYIIIGILCVYITAEFFNKIMHYNLIEYKGDNKFIIYFTRDISHEGKIHGPRVFTIWNLSHVIYFAIGSYLFPEKRLLLWTLGLLWELIEVYWQIMNPLDIIWNSIGILIGMFLHS
jgi:hypothetical protein